MCFVYYNVKRKCLVEPNKKFKGGFKKIIFIMC